MVTFVLVGLLLSVLSVILCHAPLGILNIGFRNTKQPFSSLILVIGAGVIGLTLRHDLMLASTAIALYYMSMNMFLGHLASRSFSRMILKMQEKMKQEMTEDKVFAQKKGKDGEPIGEKIEVKPIYTAARPRKDGQFDVLDIGFEDIEAAQQQISDMELANDWRIGMLIILPEEHNAQS